MLVRGLSCTAFIPLDFGSSRSQDRTLRFANSNTAKSAAFPGAGNSAQTLPASRSSFLSVLLLCFIFFFLLSITALACFLFFLITLLDPSGHPCFRSYSLLSGCRFLQFPMLLGLLLPGPGLSCEGSCSNVLSRGFPIQKKRKTSPRGHKDGRMPLALVHLFSLARAEKYPSRSARPVLTLVEGLDEFGRGCSGTKSRRGHCMCEISFFYALLLSI